MFQNFFKNFVLVIQGSDQDEYGKIGATFESITVTNNAIENIFTIDRVTDFQVRTTTFSIVNVPLRRLKI